MRMKNIIYGLGFVFAVLSGIEVRAQGLIHSVNCRNVSGANNRGFQATVDDSMYTAGSGYAVMRNAEFHDNYLSASLLCQIDQVPGKWGCVGFENNVPSQVIRVEVTLDLATHHGTVSYVGSQRFDWTCQ
jgi:hypothetical protein